MDPDHSPPASAFPPEEPATGVCCLACGGDHTRRYETRTGYQSVTCPHCTEGFMSPEQFQAWKVRRARR